MIERWKNILLEMASATQAARRTEANVHLIAVSKTHPFSAIDELYKAGQRDFGENYVQELSEKAVLAINAGMKDIRWHFIGHLQTNKVKNLLPHVFSIHGVGSLKLATEISKRADRVIPIFIEVNLDGEESKSGVQISELRNLVEAVSELPNLKILGLMGIPDPNRPGGARAAFHQLWALAADLGPLTARELSMGMTADFNDAIAEGATYVRVGTAIFGSRSPREKL